jgi:hypothetical protein
MTRYSIFHLDYLCDLDDQASVLPAPARARIESIREELSWVLQAFDDEDAEDADATHD